MCTGLPVWLITNPCCHQIESCVRDLLFSCQQKLGINLTVHPVYGNMPTFLLGKFHEPDFLQTNFRSTPPTDYLIDFSMEIQRIRWVLLLYLKVCPT